MMARTDETIKWNGVDTCVHESCRIDPESLFDSLCSSAAQRGAFVMRRSPSPDERVETREGESCLRATGQWHAIEMRPMI